jgi:hypothetical protein
MCIIVDDSEVQLDNGHVVYGLGKACNVIHINTYLSVYVLWYTREYGTVSSLDGNF